MSGYARAAFSAPAAERAARKRQIICPDKAHAQIERHICRKQNMKSSRDAAIIHNISQVVKACMHKKPQGAHT